MIYLQPLSKKARFNNAVSLIQDFLTQYKLTYKFIVKDQTTNNYKKFKKETLETGIMLVSSEGCENTIYTDKKFNIIARVWHDHVHLKHDLDFSYKCEITTAQHQIDEIVRYMDARGTDCVMQNDVKELIYHDIITQAKYYKNTGEFVNNQYKFVYSHFLGKGA